MIWVALYLIAGSACAAYWHSDGDGPGEWAALVVLWPFWLLSAAWQKDDDDRGRP